MIRKPVLYARVVKIQAALFNDLIFSLQEMQVFNSSYYASLWSKYFIAQHYDNRI